MSEVFETLFALADLAVFVAVTGWVVKSTLLLAVALLVCRLMDHSSAAFRYVLLRGSVLGVMLLAVAAPLLPVWKLPASSNVPAILLQLNATIQSGGATGTGGDRWLIFAISIWGLGITVLALRFLIGVAVMAVLVRAADPISDKGLLAVASGIEAELGIKRPVRYLTSANLGVPATWGIVRPVVILPSNSQLTATETNMLLRHELAHVRRHDVFWLNVTTILTLIQWFNPLMWIVKRKMQIESEYACDNYVLNGHIEPDSYARHILETARSVSFGGTLISTHMAFNSHLEGRIMSILNNRKRDYLTGRSANYWVAAGLLLGCLTLAGFTLESCSTAGDSETGASVSGAEQATTSPDTFVDVDTYPEMIYQHTPVYPESATKAGIEGVVWVKVFVSEDGSVSDAIAVKSSGNADLDNAALASALNNKFKPAIKDGKPVSLWVTYKVEFALSDKEDSDI